MLKNVLILSSNPEKAKYFYEALLGLTVIRKFDNKIIFTEGLVIENKKDFETEMGEAPDNKNTGLLYFEEYNFDGFLERMKKYEEKMPVEIATKESIEENGKRFIRLYDPEKYIVEIREI